LSILPRISVVAVCLALAACTPEQSKAIGNAPKKTVDKVTTDVTKAMQQGGQDSERLKEDQK
jgi:hypothetical protein